MLKQFYPQAELKKTIELENLRPTARRYAEIDRMIKEAENEKKLLGNQLKAAMGDAEVCLCGEYKIQWSNRVSNRLDTTLLKKEKPEIYNEFAKQSQTRTFTYKENIA